MGPRGVHGVITPRQRAEGQGTLGFSLCVFYNYGLFDDDLLGFTWNHERRKGKDNLRGLQKQLIFGIDFLNSNLTKQFLQLLLIMEK